jgi:OmpA-OmpF porin, OOP family
MKKILLTVILAVASSAYAHDNWISTSGEVVKTGTGLCVRNSSWTPATAAPECDGALQPKKEPPRVAVTMPAPAPKVQVPAAKQVPVAVKASYSTDTFFDFDKSVIKPAGKQALDDLIVRLKGVSIEVVVVVGHTDSVGTDAYNMKLGARRAEAVKAYLISKGLDRTRVYTESKGERQPVADNKTREGRAKNRRVVVEVVGTK